MVDKLIKKLFPVNGGLKGFNSSLMFCCPQNNGMAWTLVINASIKSYNSIAMQVDYFDVTAIDNIYNIYYALGMHWA